MTDWKAAKLAFLECQQAIEDAKPIVNDCRVRCKKNEKRDDPKDIPQEWIDEGVDLLTDALASFAAGMEIIGQEPTDPTDPIDPGDWTDALFSGLQHKATTEKPVKRLTWKPPVGMYRKAELKFNLVRGPWSAEHPEALHNVCWWTLAAKNTEMFGYLNHFGTPKERSHFRHGLDNEADEKTKEIFPWVPTEGEMVEVVLTWDGQTKANVVWKDSSENEIASLGHWPTNKTDFEVDGKGIVVDFGFPGTNPAEPASIGWEWSDVVLTLWE